MFIYCCCLGVPYIITVYTDDKRNISKDAQVHVVMLGKRTSSSEIFLHGLKFDKQSPEKFSTDSPEELSPLTALDVKYVHGGVGSAWHLNKVCLEYLIDENRTKKMNRRVTDE
jgi:hypothetical protein